jgi:hypothetical protein
MITVLAANIVLLGQSLSTNKVLAEKKITPTTAIRSLSMITVLAANIVLLGQSLSTNKVLGRKPFSKSKVRVSEPVLKL